tara:strand:+ start:3204 stop:3599 length:396 start_codon:yes stop_codon:yes gene_type:complete
MKNVYRNRPISPHVTAYNLGWTGSISILHRLTGIVLSLYLLFIVIAFKFFTFHISNYQIYEVGYHLNNMNGILLSIVGLLLIISFFFHLMTGTRHLVWDTGAGFDLKFITKSSYVIVIASISIGLITWLIL